MHTAHPLLKLKCSVLLVQGSLSAEKVGLVQINGFTFLIRLLTNGGDLENSIASLAESIVQ